MGQKLTLELAAHKANPRSWYVGSIRGDSFPLGSLALLHAATGSIKNLHLHVNDLTPNTMLAPAAAGEHGAKDEPKGKDREELKEKEKKEQKEKKKEKKEHKEEKKEKEGEDKAVKVEKNRIKFLDAFAVTVNVGSGVEVTDHTKTVAAGGSFTVRAKKDSAFAWVAEGVSEEVCSSVAKVTINMQDYYVLQSPPKPMLTREDRALLTATKPEWTLVYVSERTLCDSGSLMFSRTSGELVTAKVHASGETPVISVLAQGDVSVETSTGTLRMDTFPGRGKPYAIYIAVEFIAGAPLPKPHSSGGPKVHELKEVSTDLASPATPSAISV